MIVSNVLVLRVARDSAGGTFPLRASGMITVSALAADALSVEDFEKGRDLDLELENVSLASFSSYLARMDDKLVLGLSSETSRPKSTELP